MKLSKKSQRYLDNMMHTLQWIAQQKEDVKNQNLNR